MNTPVSFEIAKLLKEKGFNKPTLHFFFEDGILIENSYEDTVGMDYGSPFEIEFSQLTDNWNNGWVRKKNGGMCLGCDKSKGYLDIYSAPTIAEVVMWLYEKHGIWIYTRPFSSGYFHGYIVDNSGEMKEAINNINFNSPTEAYEAAIEYALNNLI